MNRYIYLDFDGVIFTRASYAAAERAAPLSGVIELALNGLLADPESCQNLLTLIQRSGASIIFSTSWRINGERVCAEILDACLKQRVGIQGRSGAFYLLCSRGMEILSDLRDRGLTWDQIVVLDDDLTVGTASPELAARWVQTHYHGEQQGFTAAALERALALWGLEGTAIAPSCPTPPASAAGQGGAL